MLMRRHHQPVEDKYKSKENTKQRFMSHTLFLTLSSVAHGNLCCVLYFYSFILQLVVSQESIICLQPPQHCPKERRKQDNAVDVE